MKCFFIALVVMLFIPMIAHAGNPDNGKRLFFKKCKSCHRLTEGIKVGPSLLGVTQRRSDEWLDSWLKNPKEVIKSGDPIAVELYKKFRKRMPKYKLMQDKQNRDDVISFLKTHNVN